ANGLGVLFEYDAVNNVYTKKFDFSTPNGVYPEGSLIETANGKLYGMTPGGGANNQGVLFEYDVSINVYTKKVDYSFLNGINPYSSMIKASNGKLYGLTLLGGANNQGVLFEYDANSNVYSKRFDFSSTNGSNPRGSLMEAVNGKLYGMTQNGGVNASGVLFEYNMTNNSYSKKFDFSPSNASSPFGSLIEASNSKLYGMTNQGGVNGLGVLFEYNTSNNVYIKKHDFSSANGSNPRGSLIEASNGKLYGMTVVGGASNQGVLFEYDANINSYTKKFDFSAPNGIYPEGSLIEASNGKLYGMTSGGGTNGLGVLFEYDVNSTVYTKKYDFSTANGSNPRGSLIEVTNGKLYGMTYGGGASNQGVLFEYDVNSNVYTKKYDFSGNDGNNPTGSLVKANNGKLYGMTSGGGTTGFSGVLFEYDATSNVFSKKFDFDFFKGSTPQGSLSKAANGKLYGMTSGGGTNGWGVLFEYDANSNIYTKKFEFSGATGYRPIYTNLIEVNLIPPCINPTVPMLSATNNVICSGNSTSLSIGTGSLNSATNWQWYSGSCGGTTEGSGASITVSPTSTTTYYARGEGGCVTPDLCASITVTVNPNVNAGVVTGVANLCIGGTATYTSNGDAGGSWSSSNELAATVNVSTGLVTALSAGTTTITYTINTGCAAPQSASTSLTVNPNVNAGVVTGAANLCIGGTATYTSNGDPGGSWSSSNELAATVNVST
ncbi:MAG TPA: Ig-like domain-containing protein, partial [Ferruginibacter sp.]|nr:Ig-like domain-containing protein [Ferruginibacter sp.]